MADITLMGATYQNVPAVQLPKTGGGLVTFYENAGLIIPAGWGYYNGYLLPQIPYDDEYTYAFIRTNESTNVYNLVLGNGQWRSKPGTNATLDNWALWFSTLETDGARQYTIPKTDYTTTASDWGEYTISTATYYGTNSGRKVIFSDHDIMIQNTTNILYKHGVALLPPA